jgi:hypothetical protein
MWNIPKIWDSPVWIIGGGRSLKEQAGIESDIPDKHRFELVNRFLRPRLEDKRVIGLNRSLSLGDWIDIAYFGDTRFLDWYTQDIFNFKNLIISCAIFLNNQMNNVKKAGIKQVTRSRYRGIDLTRPRNEIGWFGNTGASAIHLALLLGVTKIYLLGYDGFPNPKNIRDNNWWSPYPDGYAKSVEGAEKTYNGFRKSFDIVAKGLTKYNVECINLTPNTKIEAFPTGDLEEELEKC